MSQTKEDVVGDVLEDVLEETNPNTDTTTNNTKILRKRKTNTEVNLIGNTSKLEKLRKLEFRKRIKRNQAIHKKRKEKKKIKQNPKFGKKKLKRWIT